MWLLVPAIALMGQDKPAIDRSAEESLRKLFTTVSSLHGAHLFVSYYRSGSADYYLPDHTNDFWFGAPGQFRSEVNTLSGDSSSLTISDGKSVLTDPLDDDQTILLNKGGRPIYESIPREPLMFFVAGPDAFDKLVSKDGPVTFATADSGEKAIEFRSGEFGKIVIAYKDGANPLPTRIDMYRSFRRRDSGTESTTPTTKEYIGLVSTGTVPSSMFAIVVPKGKKFQDNREKSGT